MDDHGSRAASPTRASWRDLPAGLRLPTWHPVLGLQTGWNHSPSAYKRQPRLHTISVEYSRSKRIVSSHKRICSLFNLSSLRLLKQILTHNRRRLLRSSDTKEYKSSCPSYCLSWCSSHPLLWDSTICSILLAGGKKYRQVGLWITSFVDSVHNSMDHDLEGL
jgi:hypothetical protein